MHLQVIPSCAAWQDFTAFDLPALSCCTLIVQIKYIARALHHVTFSFWMFFPVLQVIHICIISETCHFRFLLILTITESDFNIEHFITNIAMITQMQKIWRMKVEWLQNSRNLILLNFTQSPFSHGWSHMQAYSMSNYICVWENFGNMAQIYFIYSHAPRQ